MFVQAALSRKVKPAEFLLLNRMENIERLLHPHRGSITVHKEHTS